MSILLGGEPFPSSILQRTLRPHRAAVYSIYGVTEVSSWASLCRLGKVGDESVRCDCPPPVISCTPIGFPMLATRLNVLKSDGRLESVLTVTRELGGYAVMMQKSPVVVDNDLQQVLASLPNVEPWRTADLVMEGECGRCLWFVGREDRTVKRFGCQINLERLEDCIMKCKLPRRLEIRFCICDLKLQCETQKLVAKIGVVSRPGGTMTTCLTNHYRNRLQSHILTHLRRNFEPTFEPWMPSRFIFYEGSPEISAHGKIVRKLRVKKTRSLVHRAAYFAKLWCEESGCNVEVIHPQRTFFSIGGSSLGALHLVEVLVQRFPRLITLRNDLIRHIFSSTFGDFVQFLCDTPKFLLNNLPQNPSIFVHSECVHQRASSIKILQPNIKHRVFTKGSTIYSSVGSLEGSYLEVAWKFPLGKCVDASALVLSSGTSSSEPPLVFIGSHSGQFSSLQLDTGEPLWHCSSEAIGGRIEAAATYGNFPSAFVSVGTLNGRLNTIDLMTGKKLWHFYTGGPIKTAPTFSFDLGLLVLGSHGRVVHAIDPRTPQQPAWINRFDNSPIVSSITQFSSRQFLVASLGGSVGCIDCRNPQETVWLHCGLPPVFTSPIYLTDMDGRSLTVITCVDGNICSYYTLSGQTAWCSSLSCEDRKCTIFSDPVFRSPESDLLISSSGGMLFSFDTKTAQLLWEMNCLADLLPGDLGQLGTTSILRTSYESILVFNRADGRVLLCPHPESTEAPLPASLPMLPVVSYQLPDVSFSSPVLCEDVRSNKIWLLAGCRDDNVYGMTLCVR
ncbi:acyl-CoA synthetase [Paragonimus westermani]|uniref:Acyl-CoA synthetase n=1 Tax=Paragonimus westermani TaxID=34504 RepID=A0A5J4N716_9TREM|nr:acyl-CoA synthetase [Paragonimus westermani]